MRVLRSSGLYGPLRAGTGSRSARLVDLLLRHARAGRPLHIDAEGDGRDRYLYIKDLAWAAAAAALCDHHSPDWLFNVGPGEITTIHQLCRTMSEVVPTAKFTVTCTGEPHAASGPLDVARMRATFGFGPAYSLREGLADYVKLRLAGALMSLQTSVVRSVNDADDVTARTLFGICTTLKPAPRTGGSATRSLLTYALESVVAVYPDVAMLDLREHRLPLFDGRGGREYADPHLDLVTTCVERRVLC